MSIWVAENAAQRTEAERFVTGRGGSRQGTFVLAVTKHEIHGRDLDRLRPDAEDDRDTAGTQRLEGLGDRLPAGSRVRLRQAILDDLDARRRVWQKVRRAGRSCLPVREANALRVLRTSADERSFVSLTSSRHHGNAATAMVAEADELRAMIAALAGSQALTLDALRRRGLIGEEDIQYILAVTEQGVEKAVGSAGLQTVVQMIRMCLQQLSTS